MQTIANKKQFIRSRLATIAQAGTTVTRYTMKKPPSKNISIFLSLDADILNGYFNPQDPAPMYKRQLSFEFEQYVVNCIRSAKRSTAFCYKINFHNEQDKQYAEPLMHAIRHHFSQSRVNVLTAFEKFKRRTYMLLFASITVVVVCQGLLPMLLVGEHSIHPGLHNTMDVLCWVILWKPIDRLIFYWNPFLKDISIMTRLEKAEVTVTQIES